MHEENGTHLHYGGKPNWYNYYEELYGGFKKLKTELLYDPAILFGGIYPDKIWFEKIQAPLYL